TAIHRSTSLHGRRLQRLLEDTPSTGREKEAGAGSARGEGSNETAGEAGGRPRLDGWGSQGFAPISRLNAARRLSSQSPRKGDTARTTPTPTSMRARPVSS